MTMEEQLAEAQKKMREKAEARAKAEEAGEGPAKPSKPVSQMTLAEQLQH